MENSGLIESFKRVNERYYGGALDEKAYSLAWKDIAGKYGLVRYGWKSQTILVNPKMREDAELLDYVMLHELLHTTRGFRYSRRHRGKFNNKMKELLGILEYKRLEAKLKAVDVKQRQFRKRYVYQCPGCGLRITRKKKAKNVSCAKCDKKYNPKYKFTLVEEYTTDEPNAKST